MKTLTITCLLITTVFSTCNRNDESGYEVAVNEQFEIELVSNLTTAYSWEWINKESIEIVDSIDWNYTTHSPGAVGSGGVEVWKFIGVKKGIDSIKLAHRLHGDPASTAKIKTIGVEVK